MANALTKIQTDGLKADAISGAKVADDAVNSEHYADGSIDTAHIADSQITTGKIADANVTTAKIAADAVTAAKIADDAVGAEHIEQLDNNLQFADSVHAKFGTDNDLAVYHDGNNANIINTTGDLYIEDSSGDIYIRAKASENSIVCKDDGSVDLYYDNSKKLETTSAGIDVTGQVKGDDITIEKTSGNLSAYFTATDGLGTLEVGGSTGAFIDIKTPETDDFDLRIDSSGSLTSAASITLTVNSNENGLRVLQNGAVEAYHDNSKKFETTANGITVQGTVTATGGGLGGLFSSYAMVWDQKSATTAGGSFDSGAWRTRDLNSEEDPDGIVSISSNEFTLGAGTYLIKWRAPAYDVQTHESRLTDVTNSNSYPGTTELCWSAETDQSWSEGMKRVTIGGNTAFKIEHYGENSSGTNGFGISGPDWGMANIFTQVEIYKES